MKEEVRHPSPRQDPGARIGRSSELYQVPSWMKMAAEHKRRLSRSLQPAARLKRA